MKLTALPCSAVKAPQIEESPVSIECRVKDIQHFGTHDMFLAEIVAVNIDDKYLNEEGRLTLEKAGLIAYVHGATILWAASRQFWLLGQQSKTETGAENGNRSGGNQAVKKIGRRNRRFQIRQRETPRAIAKSGRISFCRRRERRKI